MKNMFLKIFFVAIIFFSVTKVSAKEMTCAYTGDLSFNVIMKSETNITYTNDSAKDFANLFKNSYKNDTDCPTLYSNIVPSPDPLASREYTLSSTSGTKLNVKKTVTGDENNGGTTPPTSSNRKRATCEYGKSGYGIKSDYINVEYTIDYDFSNSTYELNTSYKYLGHLVMPAMSDEKTFVDEFVKDDDNTLECKDAIYAYVYQGVWTIYASEQDNVVGDEYIFDKTSGDVTDIPSDEIECPSSYGKYYVTATSKRFVSSLALNGASSHVIDDTSMDDFKKNGKIVCPTQFYYVQNHGPSSTEYMIYGPVTKPPIEFGVDGKSTKMYNQDQINKIIEQYYNNENNGPTGPISCDDFVNDGVNIISELFNILMIIGPILALVLGGIDFAKATLQSDENALKKAGTNFGKRIIAAILLFLLPLIINLVLGIAFNAGVFEGMNKAPNVCLENK